MEGLAFSGITGLSALGFQGSGIGVFGLTDEYLLVLGTQGAIRV